MHDIFIIGRLFLIKNTHSVLDSFHWFFFHFCKDFQKNLWYFMRYFISSASLPSCPLSTCLFPLHVWAVHLTVYVLSLLAASFFSPLWLLRATHSPSCCEADRWTRGKWKPISHHLCCGVSLKAQGIRLTFQLWMCASVCLCVPDNLLFGRVTLCTELEMRPFHVSPARTQFRQKRRRREKNSSGNGWDVEKKMCSVFLWMRCRAYLVSISLLWHLNQ